MIAVIADDFTGAAEIGGIGLRHGLQVVIETGDIQHHNTDLLVIATDSRSLPAGEAAGLITRVTEKLLELKPSFIYKKIDSVLRGNVAEELVAQMKASSKKRAVIIAANPIFNRIINDGKYTIDNVPLNETFFSNDPEYPIQSASVLEIIGADKKYLVSNNKPTDSLPEKGLIIGDVSNVPDLVMWTSHISESTLAAGASGFFDALLQKNKLSKDPEQPAGEPYGENTLYIFGSTYPKDNDFINRLVESGYYISNMPHEMYYNENFDKCLMNQWSDEIADGIHNKQKVVVSVNHPPANEQNIANRIKEIIGILVKKVMERIPLHELLIEGGSTTSVVLQQLNIKKLFPIQELDTGVIRMRIDGIPGTYLTTKPGSYYWPDKFWQPQEIQSLNDLN